MFPDNKEAFRISQKAASPHKVINNDSVVCLWMFLSRLRKQTRFRGNYSKRESHHDDETANTNQHLQICSDKVSSASLQFFSLILVINEPVKSFMVRSKA